MRRRLTVTRRMVDSFGSADAYNEIRWVRQSCRSGKEAVFKLGQRLSGKPLQFVIGNQPFNSAVIQCIPPTLIPRQETEFWVDKLIARFCDNRQLRVLDLCTGSGCIGVSIAKELHCDSVVVVDSSPKACKLATINARNNLTKEQLERFEVKQMDILSESIDLSSYNVITINPPYITQRDYKTLHSEVRDWEDKDALLAGGDEYGLVFYKRMIYLLKDAFNKQVWMEVGYNQAQLVVKLAKQSDVANVELIEDPFNDRINRVVILHL
ncbi:hypothetical protein E3P96_02617 [Wallemia ichthyophaga]|nr:hypothetical protein E3P96_02617 [Wallemia ichthyophaga]